MSFNYPSQIATSTNLHTHTSTSRAPKGLICVLCGSRTDRPAHARTHARTLGHAYHPVCVQRSISCAQQASHYMMYVRFKRVVISGRRAQPFAVRWSCACVRVRTCMHRAPMIKMNIAMRCVITRNAHTRDPLTSSSRTPLRMEATACETSLAHAHTCKHARTHEQRSRSCIERTCVRHVLVLRRVTSRVCTSCAEQVFLCTFPYARASPCTPPVSLFILHYT